MDNPKIFKSSFAGVYPHYVNKAERKGKTKDEVDFLICWLTGYNKQQLQKQIDDNVSFETFFAQAPKMTEHTDKITGVICGYRIEDMEPGLMKQIRWMDKLIDELAKGRKMEKILRGGEVKSQK